MGFGPDARLVLTDEVDLRSLPLTPADFFVYSRINSLRDAKPSVAEIISASGQSEDVARATISKLIELGVVRLDGDAGAQPKRIRTSSGRQLSLSPDVRAKALSRKRELLEAQMRSMRERAAARKAASGDEAARASERGVAQAQPEGEAELPVSRPAESSGQRRAPRAILEQVEPVGQNDPRLVTGTGVDLLRQRRLLGLRDSLRHVGHFEILGLEPIDDTKVIRRAYHVVSREFHPDSFYGKELGSFRQILDELFRRARASYEFLLDPAQRKPLVEAHRAKLATERQMVEAAERRQREAEQSKAEAELAEKQRVAREARAARDRQRQERIMSRAVSQRRKQANKHAEQAERELRAGRHGTAATLFRLAYEQDPSNAHYERSWRQSLHTARQNRSKKAYQDGLRARQNGWTEEAAKSFATAAEADPTLRHLAAAAGSMAVIDPQLASTFAKSALELLADSRAQRIPVEDDIIAEVHEGCARAFSSADDKEAALEQARLAHELAPTDARRALLKSIKVT